MKTYTKFALAALTAVLFAGSALADDGWLVIDNHHGSLTYLRRPTFTETQSQPTVGIVHHGIGIGHKHHNGNRQTLQQVTTSQGTVSYFTPAE
jgi:hypothetical protein